MKFVAFLRGINVGGNNIIKMTDLKKAIEKCGFSEVSTFIQSGNVIFASDEKNMNEILNKLGDSLLGYFNYNSRIIVKNYDQLNKIVSEVPDDWDKRDDLRCYIAFIGEPLTAQDVRRETELKDGVDFIKEGKGVLYMSTLLSGLTRSRLTKLITSKMYRDITIRNYTTTRKILALMQK
jgi:uncharacterized protein (DUF1697 family)